MERGLGVRIRKNLPLKTPNPFSQRYSAFGRRGWGMRAASRAALNDFAIALPSGCQAKRSPKDEFAGAVLPCR
jgi:hypothetical protein